MKTCRNITATSWPTKMIAKAMRLNRHNEVGMFRRELSVTAIGQRPGGYLDKLTVSRF